jgi:hypothetical protein
LALSGYIVGTPNARGSPPCNTYRRGVATINPYFHRMRVNSDGAAVCGNQRAHYFSSTLLHEARHAYQGFMSEFQGNDREQDFLVNTITIVYGGLSRHGSFPPSLRRGCDQ